MSEIEQDFAEVAKQINAKIKEATDALKEANRIGKEASLPSLIYTHWTRYGIISDNRCREYPLNKDALKNYLHEIEEKSELIKVSDLESEINIAGWSTSSSYC